MEEHLRWRAFAVQEVLSSKLSALLETPGGAQLVDSQLDTSATTHKDEDEHLTLKVIQTRLQNFFYLSAEDLAGDCLALAVTNHCTAATFDSIKEVLEVQQAPLTPKKALVKMGSEAVSGLGSESLLKHTQRSKSVEESVNADEPACSDTASLPGSPFVQPRSLNVRHCVHGAPSPHDFLHRSLFKGVFSRSLTTTRLNPNYKKISRRQVSNGRG